MKVRTLVSMVGAPPFDGTVGAVVDIESDEAARLIAVGYVEPVDETEPSIPTEVSKPGRKRK